MYSKLLGQSPDANGEIATAAETPSDGTGTNNSKLPPAIAAKFKAAAFAEIVSVLMRSQVHKRMTLDELQTLILPAVVAQQYIVAKAKAEGDEDSAGVPVGVVFWASVNAEVDRRLSDTSQVDVRLSAGEWTSGEHLWVIEVIGAPNAATAMIEELKQSKFRGRTFKARVLRDGKPAVQEFAA